MNEQLSWDAERMRHSAAHVLAAAVCRLFDSVRLDIGPATDEGFYYDFDLPHRLTPEDFPKIEEEMRRIVEADLPFERLEYTRDEARRLLERLGQTYKLDRLAEIPDHEPIMFYRCGEFIDLCRGPHVERTGQIGPFKLISVAGSYYRGIETNPMLQRVYGVVFPTQDELSAYLARLEEARRRDHRRLGQELGLFSIEPEVGSGLILWHPKGARIRAIIEEFWRREHYRSGYELVYTPHIGRAGLWETSGHLGFYRESMYSPMTVDEVEYFVKPMNCPFHILIYKSRPRSYRELPLRWAELGTVYRYEKAGVLHGLLRVRGFTQDDAHIFCATDQVEREILEVVRFARRMWAEFGFTKVRAYLATRPEKAVGDVERWAQATRSLERALLEEQIPYEIDEGGGAFYGPKIDLKVQDAIGREWQMSTVQFDFNLPERFGLAYTGPDGREHRPYMIHRALFGSIERFFGILIEHYAGAFPLWLAPEQVRVLPITDRQLPYAEEVANQLRARDLRTTVDGSPDKIGAKIRRAQLERIPYMAVVGAREAQAGRVALRSRTAGDLGDMDLADAIARLKEEEARHGRSPDAGSPAAPQVMEASLQ